MKEHGEESTTPMEVAIDMLPPKEPVSETIVVSTPPVVHQDERDATEGKVTDTKETQRSDTDSPVSAAKDLLDANLPTVSNDATPMLEADVPQVDDAVVDSLLMDDLKDANVDEEKQATDAAEQKSLAGGETEDTIDASNVDVTGEDDLVVSPISTTNDDGVHTFEDVADDEPTLEEEVVKAITDSSPVAAVESGEPMASPSTVAASRSNEEAEHIVVEAGKIDEDRDVPAVAMPQDSTNLVEEKMEKDMIALTKAEVKEIIDDVVIKSNLVQDTKNKEGTKIEVSKEEPLNQINATPEVPDEDKSDKEVEAPPMAAAQTTAPKESKVADNKKSNELLPHEKKETHQHPAPHKHNNDKHPSPKMHKHGEEDAHVSEPHPYDKEHHQHCNDASEAEKAPAPPTPRHVAEMEAPTKNSDVTPKKKHIEENELVTEPHPHDKEQNHQHSKDATEGEKAPAPPTPKPVTEVEASTKNSDVTPKKKPWWKSTKKEHKKSKKTTAPLGPADEIDAATEVKMPCKGERNDVEAPQDEKEEQATSPTNNTLRGSLEEPETGFVCGLDMRSKTGEDRQDCACCIQ